MAFFPNAVGAQRLVAFLAFTTTSFALSCSFDTSPLGSPQSIAGDGAGTGAPVKPARASAAGSTQVGVTGAAGTEPPSTSADPGSGGMNAAAGGAAGGSGGAPPTPPSAGQGSDAGSGTSPQPMAGGEPPVPSDAGTNMPDCTQVAWANDGHVEVPTVEAIPAAAGNGKPFAALEGLDDFGYEQAEFLFSGTSPAFTTRMNVYKPKDAAKFSGTVFVEWYNVSAQLDFAVEWASSRDYFMREGHGYVAVSAQPASIGFLQQFDPARYAKLQHPGDSFADSIFSRAGAGLKSLAETVLGNCYPVRALIAVGQSQAAFRLASYVDNTHPVDKVYDGFLLHSGTEPRTNDPGVPVMELFTMTEANSALTDGPTLVKWVVAGATHNDRRTTLRAAEVATQVTGQLPVCVDSMNDFPAYRAYNAALDALHAWVREGKKPSPAPPFEVLGFGGLRLDDNFNVVGGLRLPDIEVPIATYSTTSSAPNPADPTGGLACSLGGTAASFSADKLATLYPTHDDYVAKYKAAADKALAAGYLLQADYDDAIQQAQAAPVPR